MPVVRAAARREKGAPLAMSIVFTALCIVVTTGQVSYVVGDYRATHADWRRVQALYCAEAGVEKAAEALRIAPTTTALAETTLTSDVSGADGSYEVTIAPVPNDPLGSKTITATGYVPSKAKAAVSRTVVATYTSRAWDFGVDAVRARQGIEYGSNDVMTCVVDSSYNVITDLTVDANVRVTGQGATIGDVESIAANKGTVAGSVWAPGFVDVQPTNARYISEGNPANYIPDAFPPPNVLGRWDGGGNLIWPTTSGTWSDMYYREALVGGTSYASSGTFSGSRFIDLGGTGTLTNATLTGPGTVFVRGNLGGNVTNGAPPVTLVISGNFTTSGGEFYRFNAGSNPSPPPSLMTFGPEMEIAGNSNWFLDGPLMALNPNGEIIINDSAIGCFGALISNGMVKFKSSKGAVGYPRTLQGKRFTAQGLPSVVSYAAR